MLETLIPEPRVDFSADDQATQQPMIYLYMREPQVFPENAQAMPLSERTSRKYDGIAFFYVSVERAEEIVKEIQSKIDEIRNA